MPTGPFPFSSTLSPDVAASLLSLTRDALAAHRPPQPHDLDAFAALLNAAPLRPIDLARAAADSRLASLDADALRSLRQWWVRCAEEGWCEYYQIDDAFTCLAALLSDSPPHATDTLALIRAALAPARAKAG